MKYGQLRVCPEDHWAQFAAVHIAHHLKSALNVDSSVRISVALAGGTTPAPVYRALAQMVDSQIDWRRVDLFLGDERMVPRDDPESNYRSANESFRSSSSDLGWSIHHVKTENSPNDAAWKYEKLIRSTVVNRVHDIPALNLVILGLGSDGHTASLFPGAETLHESKRLVIPATHPVSSQDRVTFTLPVLGAARAIIFLVCGPGKSEIMARIAHSEPTPAIPASLVAERAQELVWILDEAAAKDIVA